MSDLFAEKEPFEEQPLQPHYAHSGVQVNGQDWQKLQDHLLQVAALSQDRASAFGAGEWAHLIGLLHDLGKYSQVFQQRLRGSEQRADHATAGAKIVVERLAQTMGPQWGQIAKLMAFAIAGHHTGLANGVDEGQDRSTHQQRLQLTFGKDIPELDEVWCQVIELPGNIIAPPLKPHEPNGKYVHFGLVFSRTQERLTSSREKWAHKRSSYQTESFDSRPRAPVERRYPVAHRAHVRDGCQQRLRAGIEQKRRGAVCGEAHLV